MRSWPALEGAPASIANDYTLVIKVMILTDLMRAHQETKQLIAQASRAYRKALERTSNDTRAVPALNQEYEPSPA